MTSIQENLTDPLSNWPYGSYVNKAFGPPIRLIVSDNDYPFHVHTTILAEESPLFRVSAPIELHARGWYALVTNSPLILKDIPTEDFKKLMLWIYDNKAPFCEGSDPESVRSMFKLWIVAGKLGMWLYQNAAMRLIMAAMQPHDCILPLSTVREVYNSLSDNVAAMKLRKFISLLFVQRSGPAQAVWFSKEFTGLENMWKDFTQAQVVVNRIRCSRPVDANGELIDISWVQNLNMYFAGVPKTKAEFRMPEFLVWSEEADALPDKLFVTRSEAVEEAESLRRRVDKSLEETEALRRQSRPSQ